MEACGSRVCRFRVSLKGFGSCLSSSSNLRSRMTGSDPVSGTRLDALGIPFWTDLYSAGWFIPFDSVELFLSAPADVRLVNGNVYDR